MRLFRLLTLRSLFRHFLRTLLISFGITLGVASILAIGLTNQSALQAVTRLFQDTSGKSNLIVVRADSNERGLPDSLVRRIANLPGVRSAVPSLQLQTVLADKAPFGELGLSFFGTSVEGSLALYAIDPQLEPAVREYTLATGRFLSGDPNASEIVLVQEFADQNEIALEDRLAILTPGGVARLQVVGLLEKEGPGQTNNGAFGVISLSLGQKLFDRPGEIDTIDLVALDPKLEALESLKVQIQKRLGQDYSVIFPSSQGRRMTQMLSSYQIGLNFMSGMALFVGAFLIYNAFSMTVVERTREFGMLRTIGMTQRQITWMVLGEAIILGLISSALGIGLGLLMARGLSRLMEVLLGYELLLSELPIPLLVTSILIGVVTTLLAALLPAWQAGRISPLEALRVRGAVKEGWLLRNGWWSGSLLLALAAVILVRNPFPYDVQFRMGSLVVFALFIGGTLIIPVSVGIWERFARPIFRLLYGSSGRLGSSNVKRARLRTTLTVAALMVGVSLTLVVRGMTESFKVDLVEWIGAYLGGDLYVSSSVNLRRDLWLRLEAVDGVQAAAPIRYLEVRWRRPGEVDEPLTFMAVDPTVYRQVTNFVFSDSQVDQEQAIARLAQGEAVFISSVIAERYGYREGDSLLLKTASGWRDFEIAGVVVDFYNQGLVITGSFADMRRFFKVSDASTVLIKTAPDSSVSEVQERIDSLYAKRYQLTLISNQAIKGRIDTLMGQAFSMFDVMAMISVIVASLGVVNTLTMNVLERTREIGMLRSIGMTRRQVSGMILAEAGMMGLIGGALGMVFGLLLAKIFLAAMMAMSGYSLTFTMPLEGVVMSLAVAMIVSQIAALPPALRAARLAILDAIHYE
jgi:putative ABC transport system permease protein